MIRVNEGWEIQQGKCVFISKWERKRMINLGEVKRKGFREFSFSSKAKYHRQSQVIKLATKMKPAIRKERRYMKYGDCKHIWTFVIYHFKILHLKIVWELDEYRWVKLLRL